MPLSPLADGCLILWEQFSRGKAEVSRGGDTLTVLLGRAVSPTQFPLPLSVPILQMQQLCMAEMR